SVLLGLVEERLITLSIGDVLQRGCQLCVLLVQLNLGRVYLLQVSHLLPANIELLLGVFQQTLRIITVASNLLKLGNSIIAIQVTKLLPTVDKLSQHFLLGFFGGGELALELAYLFVDFVVRIGR